MARNLIPSDRTISSIKLGDKRRRLSDGGGLYLLLFVKGGSHGWRYDYSINGKRKTLSLGTYPDTGLALARQKAQDFRTLVAQGKDPSEIRQAAKEAAAVSLEEKKRESDGLPPVSSFEAVARDWLHVKHEAEVSAGHAARTLMRFEKDIFPWLGRKSVAEIKAPELLTCLRRVIERGTVETAHRVRQSCGQVFRYGIACGLCASNPAEDLKDALPAVHTSHLAAITDPKRAGQLLRAMDDHQGTVVVGAAMRFMSLVFQRPGEVRQAEWSEFDLERATWTIPSRRMKRSVSGKATGPDHVVPLSTQAVALLLELKPVTGSGSFVFPSLRRGGRPMSDAAVLVALRTLGFPKEEMTGHGFRAMARTMLAERLNFDEAVIEAQLAHAVPDALGRAYNRTEFIAQRRVMMQVWADYLDRLRIDVGSEDSSHLRLGIDCAGASQGSTLDTAVTIR